MSLAAIGAGAAYEFRWRSWAMLRDVIVANLDEATVPTFASLGDAMVSGTIDVDASALAFELETIRAWLAGKGFDELVLGPRTSNILHGMEPKLRRKLTMTEIERIRPIGTSTDLADYFATMLDSLARVCSRPRPDGTIEIVDG